LELLEKVDLPEGKEVSVTILDIPSSTDKEAFRYLNEHQGIVQRLHTLLDAGLGLSIISLADLYGECITHAIRRGTSRISMIFYAG
jgi:predicted DNA-binding antitoxin AbrB/MazE fold protein